ncbi:MAG TPA: DUF3298 domain-containing protein [Syntrophomonas sp.]|nr:DUF3298 domain-containing protein [Syntrophomonas sp.]
MKDEKLNELKNQYMEIPIPNELEFTVRKALKEGEKKKMKSFGWKKWAGVAAATVLIFTATLNMSSTAANALSDIPIIKNIVSVLTFREYSVNEDTYNANLKVPAVTGLENQALENSLNEKYLEENKKLYQEFTKDMEELKANGGGHMGIDSGYEVKTDNDQILSIGRWVVNTVGSSSTTMKYDTIDKQKEILITLPSLFKDDRYIDVISANIQQQMRAQMKADENKVYWVKVGEANEPTIDYFDTIAPDQNFYINSHGKLVISFDKYEVAPGYMGVTEFEIPTEIIDEILVSNEYIK